MWRIPTERIRLDLDGPAVEVERLHSFHVQVECLSLLANYGAAKDRNSEYAALSSLFERFVAEAQPQWDIVDGKGPVTPDARGVALLPLPLAMAMVLKWIDSLDFGMSLDEPEPQSAVDIMIPPGPMNTALKRRLAAAKKRKAA